MKTTMKVYYLALVLLLAGSAGVQAQMTIGSQDKPHDGAVLHLKSATKGLLLPNVALNNNDLTEFKLNGAAYKGTAKGMLVYNTTDDKVYVWDGEKWHSLYGGSTSETPMATVTLETANGTLTFMDRNLGANPSADPNPTSYDPETNEAFTSGLNGDYYQWGRQADGHEKWNSPVFEGSASDQDVDDLNYGQVIPESPGYGSFIMGSSPYCYDWRILKNDNLWNDSGSGLINPCPNGFRIPTKDEWDAARSSLTWNDSKHGMIGGTSFFLPAAGERNCFSGSVFSQGLDGFYWTSTAVGPHPDCDALSYALYFNNANESEMRPYFRSTGAPVRCVKK